MRNRTRSLLIAAIVLGSSSLSATTSASSHRDAPSTVNDPAADATDLYAWVEGPNLIVVADFIGLEDPSGAQAWPSFDDDVLYEIHVARGQSSLDDALTYQFRFISAPPPRVDPNRMPLPLVPQTGGTEVFQAISGGSTSTNLGSGPFAQTYTVTRLVNGGSPEVAVAGAHVPPPNIGGVTALVTGVSGGYEQYFVATPSTSVIARLANGGGRVFAGPRDDPYFADEGAFQDLLELRAFFSPGSPARDSYAYTNVHSIVLEIPLTVANGGTPVVPGQSAAQTLGIWASASRRAVTLRRRDGTAQELGPWRQVSRVGFPFFSPWFIGVQDRDLWNQRTPKDDLPLFASYVLNPILVRDAEAVNLYATSSPLAPCTGGNPAALRQNRVDLVGVLNALNPSIISFGDVLRVDLGIASAFPNGRRLGEDVFDVMGTVVLCPSLPASVDALNDGTSQNEVAFSNTFPFLAPPWEGRTAMPRGANQ